jgi:hypothetical protein
MIRNSLDWASVNTSLRHQANTKIDTPSNRYQVCRMIDNIGAEITLLSKAEVLARRGNARSANELLEKINNDIELVEEFILVAALIG